MLEEDMIQLSLLSLMWSLVESFENAGVIQRIKVNDRNYNDYIGPLAPMAVISFSLLQNAYLVLVTNLMIKNSRVRCNVTTLLSIYQQLLSNK